MGLDLFELVLEVENRFGIVLRDEELAEIVKVEDLTALVLTRIALSRSDAEREPGCPCVRAFLMLRADVRQLMDDVAFRFRPSQQIADVLSPRKRQALWKHLENRMASVPRLRRPVALRHALIGLIMLLFAVSLTPALVNPAMFPLSFFCAAGGAVFLNLVTMPLRVVPPLALATFGDVTRRLAGTTETFNSIARKSPTWIAEAVQDLVAEQLGIDRADVVPTARFIEDLGAD